MEKRNKIMELSFEFALQIILYSELLEENRKYAIVRQLLKSGTAIGANIRKAQNAESSQNFIHKFKIAGKEARLNVCLCYVINSRTIQHQKSYHIDNQP